MMLGIYDLGHSGRNWPAQGQPCVCLLAMQRSAANSLLLSPLSMGESKCGPGCAGDTKKLNVAGGEGERDTGVHVYLLERTVGGRDRWVELGRREKKGLKRRKNIKNCRGRQRNRLYGGQQEKGCEVRKDRQIWQGCSVEISGLSVGERCVPARYCTHR